MKGNIFMRILFCEIHSTFICFCKPSAAAAAAAHLYTSGPLKLENPQQQVSNCCRVVSASSDSLDQSFDETAADDDKIESYDDGSKDNAADNVLKSCIKKAPTDGVKETKRNGVQWIDNLGKELAEIKEFEDSETEDDESEGNRSSCVCTIL